MGGGERRYKIPDPPADGDPPARFSGLLAKRDPSGNFVAAGLVLRRHEERERLVEAEPWSAHGAGLLLER